MLLFIWFCVIAQGYLPSAANAYEAQVRASIEHLSEAAPSASMAAPMAAPARVA